MEPGSSRLEDSREGEHTATEQYAWSNTKASLASLSSVGVIMTFWSLPVQPLLS